MKNKTKNIIRITFAILLVVLVQIMGVTYAKYVTGVNGTGQAEVAKWAFDMRVLGQQTKNVRLVDTSNNDTLVDGKIAPGTSGKIHIVMDAEGADVDLEYALEFKNEQNKPDNLYFTYLDRKYTTLEEIGKITGLIRRADKSRNTVITVLWEWPYETGKEEKLLTNDIIDTQNANTITEFTFDIVATANQGN